MTAAATALEGLKQQLESLYDEREAGNIAEWVIESVTGIRPRTTPFTSSPALTAAQEQLLEQHTKALLAHRPVQYVLGECYFMDMKLYVDERVLIPRPETEELADWIIKHEKQRTGAAVLDIGTGSGCLSLALKNHMNNATVYAADISEGALAIAGRNAREQKLELQWLQGDILRREDWPQWPQADIIVSNPPYITLPEQESMMPHVLDYEPHLALFVTDNDPLQFYKAIEAFASEKLRPGGSVFLELHTDFAIETRQLYEQQGWRTILKQDMQGRNRMLLAQRRS